MPGQRAVQALPDTVSCEEGLGRAALLAGAAVEYHGSLTARLFEVILQGKCRRQRSGSQHVVAAAVARAAGNKRFLLHCALFLAQARESVKLAQNADGGVPLPESSQECGLNPGHPGLHGKTVLPENLPVGLCGMKFLERQFGIRPDFIGKGGKYILVGLNIADGRLFMVCHNVLLIAQNAVFSEYTPERRHFP